MMNAPHSDATPAYAAQRSGGEQSTDALVVHHPEAKYFST